MWSDEEIKQACFAEFLTHGHRLMATSNAEELLHQMRDEMQSEIDALHTRNEIFQRVIAGNQALLTAFAERKTDRELLAWAKRAYSLLVAEFPDYATVRDAPQEVRE